MSLNLLNPLKNLLLLVCAAFLSHNLSAQSLGDYRSIASGNWTDASIWQIYNGVGWTATANYPGQLAGTQDVYIEGGHSVSISSAIPNSVNSLTIGDGSGSTDNFYIAGTSNLPTQLITVADGGLIEWTSNVSFTISSGAALRIESGGTLVTDNPCNSAKRLIIGGTVYSTCNGGAGTDYSFEDLNDSGGTISVSPTSNGPICAGETLTLFSNPSGAGSPTATYSWSATGPLGYSFSSSDEDPVVPNLSSGSYTFTVVIADGTISNSGSVDVTVNPAPSIVFQPQDQMVSEGSNANFSVTYLNADTFQWQVSTDNGSTFNTISNGSDYSGTQTANLTVNLPNMDKNGYIFRVLVSNSAASCDALTSNGAMLTISVGTVITNRKITYRVNKN